MSSVKGTPTNSATRRSCGSGEASTSSLTHFDEVVGVACTESMRARYIEAPARGRPARILSQAFRIDTQ